MSISTPISGGTAIFEAPGEAAGAGRSERLVRAFDLAVILLVLPAVLVVGSLIAVAIFLDSPGPIFYRSERIGRGGRPFRMLKFRKMHRTAAGAPLTSHEDERFTPIGRLLAVTKLDELPQVWNVLRGQMRLVGPRPEIEPFVASHAEPYTRILSVLPGITGPSQLRYTREGQELAAQDDPMSYYLSTLMPEKIAMDLRYVETQSLSADLGLLLQTVVFPVRRLGGAVLDARAKPAVRLAWSLGALLCCLIAVFSWAAGSLA